MLREAAASIGFGAALVVLGLLMIRGHVAAWRTQREDGALEEAERMHLRHRYRRRMQASGLIVLLGIVLPTGDVLLAPRQMPMAFTVYVFVMLGLAAWIGLLGLGDWVATAARNRVALGRLAAQQEALERELDAIRRRGMNGRATSDDV